MLYHGCTGDFPRIIFHLDQKFVSKHAKSAQVDTCCNAGVTLSALSSPEEKRSFQFHQGCAFAPRVNPNQALALTQGSQIHKVKGEIEACNRGSGC